MRIVVLFLITVLAASNVSCIDIPSWLYKLVTEAGNNDKNDNEVIAGTTATTGARAISPFEATNSTASSKHPDDAFFKKIFAMIISAVEVILPQIGKLYPGAGIPLNLAWYSAVKPAVTNYASTYGFTPPPPASSMRGILGMFG